MMNGTSLIRLEGMDCIELEVLGLGCVLESQSLETLRPA